MDALSDLRHRFDYHFWASRLLADAIADNDTALKAKGYLAHAFAADQLWLERIKGVVPLDPVLFPEISVIEISSLLANNASNYDEYLLTANPMQAITYTTTTGTVFEHTVSDILNHILLHGMYTADRQPLHFVRRA